MSDKPGAWVDYVSQVRPATYVVRCKECGDPAGRTQWGQYRLTIFQEAGRAGGDARRYAESHNAIDHRDIYELDGRTLKEIATS
jgi:hypothetical protein